MVVPGLPVINNKHLDPELYPEVSDRIKENICFMLKCNQPVHEVDNINFHLCKEHLPYKYFNGGMLDNELEQTIDTLMTTQQQFRDEIDEIDKNYNKLSKEDKNKKLEKHIGYLQDIQKNIDHYFYNRYYKTIIDKDPNDKGFRKVKIHRQFIDYNTNTISFDYFFENETEKQTFSTELIPPFLTDEFINLNIYIQDQRLKHFTRWVVFGKLLIYYNKKKSILQVYKLDRELELDLDHIIYETNDKIIYVNQLSKDEFRADLLKQFEFPMYPGDEFPTTEKLKQHRRLLARKYHPDKNSLLSSEKMQEINTLCRILTNEDEFQSEYEQKPKIEVYIYEKTKDHIFSASDDMVKNNINNIINEIKIDRPGFTSMLTLGKDLVFSFPRIQMQIQDKMDKYNFKNQENKTNLEDDLTTIKNKYILTEYLVGSHHKSKSRHKFYKKKNKETISKVMFEDSAYKTKYKKGFLKAVIEFVKSKSCKQKYKNTFNNDHFCVRQNVYRPFGYKETVENLPEFHTSNPNPLPNMYYRSFPDVNEILSKIDAPKEEFCGLIYYFHPNDVSNNDYCFNKDSYSPEEFYDYYIFSTNQQVTRMHLYWWWYNVPENIREYIIKLIIYENPELYFLLLGNYIFKDDQVKQYFYKFFDELQQFTLGFGNQFGITPFH